MLSRPSVKSTSCSTSTAYMEGSTIKIALYECSKFMNFNHKNRKKDCLYIYWFPLLVKMSISTSGSKELLPVPGWNIHVLFGFLVRFSHCTSVHKIFLQILIHMEFSFQCYWAHFTHINVCLLIQIHIDNSLCYIILGHQKLVAQMDI